MKWLLGVLGRLKYVSVELAVLTLLLVGVTAGLYSVGGWPFWREWAGFLWLGALLGGLLCWTRWHWLVVGGYALLSGALTSLGWFGRLGNAGLELDGVRLRFLLLVERLRGWGQLWAETGAIYDRAAGIVLGCWLAWLVGVVLSRAVLRGRHPLRGGLPAAGLLAYCLFTSGRGVGLLVAFAVLLMMAEAYAAYRRVQVRWDAEGVDWPFPDSLLPEWMMGAGVMALAIGLLAWMSAWVATPEGWQRIGDWLQPAPLVLATPMAGPDNRPTQSAPQQVEFPAEAISAQMPGLEQIGTPPDNSERTVFWVWVSDPPPPPEQAGAAVFRRSYYWRSGVFDQYTGMGWRAVAPDLELPATAAELGNPSLGRYVLEQHFMLRFALQGVLPAVNAPMQSGNGTQRMAAGGEDTPLLIGNGQEEYTVVSWATHGTINQLRNAGESYPPEIVARYLQLPQDLPQRVRLLAAQLTEGAETPYDKVERVETYLRTYPYTLDVEPVPAGKDVVDYFLFDAQTGFCSHYASAMVVLLRAEGVPARVATGFVGGDYDYDRGAYRVPASAAHAWVEVYFPGYGWVEFEPTAVYDRVQRVGGSREDVQPRQRSATISRVGVGGLLAVLELGLFALMVWLLRRVEWKNSGLSPAISLYFRLRRDLALAGLVGSPSQTPAEFLTMVGRQLTRRPAVLLVLQGATQLLEKVVFGTQLPDAGELELIKRMYRRALGELLGLWLKHWTTESLLRLRWRMINKKMIEEQKR